MRPMMVFLIAVFYPTVGVADFIWNSYAFGKRYRVEVTRDALAKAPQWPADADNPPVSARKAIKLADVLRQKLVKDTKDFKWQRVSASIEFLDDGEKCIWIIRYEAHFRRGGETGQPHHLNLMVLMDGTIVEPIVSDWPDDFSEKVEEDEEEK